MGFVVQIPPLFQRAGILPLTACVIHRLCAQFPYLKDGITNTTHIPVLQEMGIPSSTLAMEVYDGR